jgi:hypothetical protein
MSKLNRSISALADVKMCTDCFNHEAHAIFKASKFDVKGYVRDRAKLDPVSLDLQKFKLSKEAASAIATVNNIRQERKK